jgi:hypothetical protein
MTQDRALEWPGRRRGLGRVALLFTITLGAYWPIWLAQIAPTGRAGSPARRGRIAVVAAALVPVLNVVFEVALAVLLPRGLRRLAEARSDPAPTETEAQTFLLLAAPAAAIAVTLALNLPVWVVGYLAWPLELPATLVVQRALNLLEPPKRAPARRRDGELIASGAIAGTLVLAGLLALVLGGGGETKSRSGSAAQEPEASDIVATPDGLWVSRISTPTRCVQPAGACASAALLTTWRSASATCGWRTTAATP